MINVIKKLICAGSRNSSRTIETNKLLEKIELEMGGEIFESAGGYSAFASAIKQLCQDGRLNAVKNSGVNGLTPALHSKFRIARTANSANTDIYKDEILTLHPAIKKEYYLKNSNEYEKDREYLQRLNTYLQKEGTGKERCTVNERSFEIFNDEKFLDSKGKAFLKKVGLGMELFNCYRTYEAFFYIYLNRNVHGNALIIENKDTFMSLLRAMNSPGSEKHNKNNISLLIYGEGNKIVKSFEFIDELCSDHPVNTVFYYGDIDYPGIDIYQRLKEKFKQHSIVPHQELYIKLMESVHNPPDTRNDAKTDISVFLNYFDKEWSDRIEDILEDRKYIPQEGLSFAKGDFEI